MTKLFFALSILAGCTLISCSESSSENNQTASEPNETEVTNDTIDNSIVYQTDNLIIKKLSDHIYEHVSFLDTDDYGKVGCNGMLVLHENEGVIFDTPTDNQGSLELINFVNNELKSEIKAIIPTHFHEDCLGGIQKFEEQNIPIYLSSQTMDLLKNEGQKFSQPINEFDTAISLKISGKKVYAEYFGEGHTKDNIIGYSPEDKTIFGGCLIKKVGASKGYLGDANTNEWSETVRKLKLKYPETEIVIPGHGKWGGTELFDYTIELFEVEQDATN